MGILFYLLGLFMNNEGLHQAFGVRQVSIYASLVLFFPDLRAREQITIDRHDDAQSQERV